MSEMHALLAAARQALAGELTTALVVPFWAVADAWNATYTHAHRAHLSAHVPPKLAGAWATVLACRDVTQPLWLITGPDGAQVTDDPGRAEQARLQNLPVTRVPWAT